VPLTFVIPSDRGAARRAREALSPLRARLDAALYDDLRLVISELVTNAVKYGPGEPITVRLDVRAPRDVRGEVIDNGRPTTSLRRAEHTGADGGFGLQILDTIARNWGVHEGSTHVWFELGDAPA
jgi:signal transduction histidine kinase